MKTVNTGYMIRAPCLGRMAAGSRRHLQLNIGRAAFRSEPRSIAAYRKDKAAFFIPKIQQSKFFRAAQRQKVRKIYGIF